LATLDRAYHYYQAGRHEEALEVGGKALDFFLEVDDRRGQGDVFGCLGLVYWSLGDYEKAVRYGQQSLRLFEATESRYGAGWVLTSLGGVYHDTGDYEQALALHKKSLCAFAPLRYSCFGIAGEFSATVLEGQLPDRFAWPGGRGCSSRAS
jgi:tetratricopeptide (TPR) repeat protein